MSGATRIERARKVVEIGRWLLPALVLLHLFLHALPVRGGRHDSHAQGPYAARSEPNGDVALVRDDGRVGGMLRFARCDSRGVYRVHTAQGWVVLSAFEIGPKIAEALIALGRTLESTLPDAVCDSPTLWPGGLQVACIASAILALVAWARRRGKVTVDVRWPHVVPVAIQSAIFAYWSIYWPGVREHLPSIVLQIGLAFGLDAALSFARFGSWRMGIGPVPMVLSANLFAWFDAAGSIAVVATAVATKVLVRRGGRHVLNPSAAGLLAGGLYLAVVPGAVWDGVFHVQNLAPNIVELIVLLSLVPIVRFNLALIPLCATMALAWVGHGPSVTAPGVVIAVALFASDPATAPRTQAGRAFFGFAVGAGIACSSWAFGAFKAPDDFSKVMPVVLGNIATPWFDDVGARWQSALEARLLDGRWRLAHAALWAGLLGALLVRDKPDHFDGALHWTSGTPLVVRDRDDVPRCEHNGAFCRPFAFATELRAWAAR